ncbi:recombinase family protein [Streptomyces sp. NPDC005774]|uniref:recombinase family protein n=1 Tax=Streptomyces sp. NPDC005774 TaxID=3364728 RepID=UPI003680B433
MPFAPAYLHLVFPGTEFEALLYGRASRDPNKQGSSVTDQLVAGRRLCQDYNWPVYEEFKDLGLSAARGARTRDDFEDLLEAIEAGPSRPGVTRIVVAFEASRYYRDLEAYVRLRNACFNAGALLCYKGKVYDLSLSEDRKATAMDAIAAEGEADDIRDRNLRTAQRTAAAGDPHGRLLFGFARDYEVVNGRLRCVRQYEDPVTGPYVFQAIERIDGGHSVGSVVRWLRSEEGATRPDGKPWVAITVRRMLQNRAYLGERLHRGEWRKASWAPIKGLDTPAGRAMFNRVAAKLSDSSRRMTRGTEPVHLLTHIGLCGHCGDHAPLLAARVGDRQVLRCGEKKDVSVSEAWLDAFVEEAVIAWFADKAKATAALVADDGDTEEKVVTAQRRINGYEEQLAEARALAEDFDEETGRFKLSAGSLASLEQRLLPKLEVEQKALRSLTGVSPLVLSLLNAPDPDVVWNGRSDDGGRGVPELTLGQRREVIRAVVTVRLVKSRRTPMGGVRGTDDSRVQLAFVGEPGFRDRLLRAPESGPVPAPRVASAGT